MHHATRRARVRHTCTECGEAIMPGDTYLRVDGVGGEWGSFVHNECRRCCYDRTRIIAHEMAEGCEWGYANPGLGGLLDALKDSGIGRTCAEDVPGDYVAGPPKHSL